MRALWCLALGLFVLNGFWLNTNASLFAEEAVHSASSSDVSTIKLRGLGGLKTSDGSKRIDYSKRAADLKITCLRDEREMPLKDGDSVSQKDFYAISFETVLDPYVYLFQIDSRGNMTQLFPNPQITDTTNPITPGKAYRLPGEKDWFYLDENKGTEQVILISQIEPIAEPERIINGMVATKEVNTTVRGIGGLRHRPADTETEMLTVRRYFVHE